jgi:hypothetical protein
MPGWTYTNGGPQGISAKLVAHASQMQGAGEQIMKETVEAAKADQIALLEAATTPTGDRRVAAGGVSAGRHETGHMIDMLDSNVTVSENTITGTWGWPNPEDYFLEQDDGQGRIPAAHSLLNSFTKAREEFFGRVLAAPKGF